MLDCYLGVHIVLSWEVLKGLIVVHLSNKIDFCSGWMSVDSGGFIHFITLHP